MSKEKKEKPDKRRIKIPIYERTLLIIITHSVDDELKEAGEVEGWPAEASVLVNNVGDVVVIIRPDANINTICHEAFHVTYEILKTAGMILSSKSEEAFAYLNGFIAEKIENEIKRHNTRKKKCENEKVLDELLKKELDKQQDNIDANKRKQIRRIEQGKPRRNQKVA